MEREEPTNRHQNESKTKATQRSIQSQSGTGSVNREQDRGGDCSRVSGPPDPGQPVEESSAGTAARGLRERSHSPSGGGAAASGTVGAKGRATDDGIGLA